MLYRTTPKNYKFAYEHMQVTNNTSLQTSNEHTQFWYNWYNLTPILYRVSKTTAVIFKKENDFAKVYYLVLDI